MLFFAYHIKHYKDFYKTKTPTRSPHKKIPSTKFPNQNQEKVFFQGGLFNTHIHWKNQERKTQQLTRRVDGLGKHLPSASFL